MNTESTLTGKVAIITGAGRGIGRSIALSYARAGAAIGCTARTIEEIDQLADQIRKENGKALSVKTDVTQLSSVVQCFEQVVATFGGLDIVVVNAGVNLERNMIENSDPENWESTIAVNLIGAYYCIKAAIPYLKDRGSGKIITIGSGLGHNGSPGSSAYACSKAGLWMLTRVLAMELRQYNISVNELIPGPVRTSIDQNYENKTSFISQFEHEWLKEPEEVVPLALFLAAQPDIGPTAQSFSLMRRDQ